MNRRIDLLIIDDEKDFRDLMQKALPGEKYNLTLVGNARDAMRAVEDREYDVGLIDLMMPGMDGIELLRKLRKKDLLTEFIILTGQGSISTAIEAMKLGCYDYLAKPFKLDELAITIRKAFEKKVLNRENRGLRTEIAQRDRYQEIVGKSPQMSAIFSLIEKITKTVSPVLVTGESGTGKELVARAIHKSGERRDKPFIVIDCAALPDSLLENELFGHEKEAFTDAVSMKRGLFEVADGGTLFIDEIGEMSMATQAKLLRVLETHQFRRLGGTQQINVDVRIVAATNRAVEEEVRRGKFREDLFYRLNTFTIHIPPLRERKEDIPLLVKHFMSFHQAGTEKKKIREKDIRGLMNYSWPGNVRELANAVERALIISSKSYITPEDFWMNFSLQNLDCSSMSGTKNLEALLAEQEKNIISRVLMECWGNRIETARILQLSRSKLYRKLRKYGLLETSSRSGHLPSSSRTAGD